MNKKESECSNLNIFDEISQNTKSFNSEKAYTESDQNTFSSK